MFSNDYYTHETVDSQYRPRYIQKANHNVKGDRVIRQLYIFSILCAALVLTYACDTPKRQSVRDGVAYTAKKTDAPPVIDGILNDACWKSADTVHLALHDGGNPEYPSNVSVCYDDAALYIAFECRDLDAASLVRDRDGPVESGEYVSVGIDADADTVTFAIIGVAPTGAVRDMFILRRTGQSDKVHADWNCDALRTSVSVYGGGAMPGTEDRFWTVEMALPYTEFYTAVNIPPPPGEEWRIVFMRSELTGRRELSGFPAQTADNGFNPSVFARLIFGGY